MDDKFPVLSKQWKLTLLFCLAGCLFGGLFAGYYLAVHQAEAHRAIVSINGTIISEDDLFQQMQVADGPRAMTQLIQRVLQIQFAKQNGVYPTDTEVKQRLAQLVSCPNYDLIVKNSQQPEALFKRDMAIQMSLESLFTQNVTVTDDDVQSYYAAQSNPANKTALFYRPAQTVVQAIELPTQAQSQVEISKLDGGQDFGEVATEDSEDASKAYGGALAPLTYGQSILSTVPVVESAVFKLRDGQRADPIFFNRAWWIFKCVHYQPEITYPFQTVAEQARRGALIARGYAVNAAQIKQEYHDFVKRAIKQAYWKQYQPELDQTM